MDHDMLRDADVCIFNYLANLKMEKKYKPLVDVFVRLDFFLIRQNIFI